MPGGLWKKANDEDVRNQQGKPEEERVLRWMWNLVLLALMHHDPEPVPESVALESVQHGTVLV
jgi:hypothetical protein